MFVVCDVQDGKEFYLDNKGNRFEDPRKAEVFLFMKGAKQLAENTSPTCLVKNYWLEVMEVS